jgi:flagellar basal-body rod protein FlgF
MDPIAAMAASGLRARMQALDLLANNLANVGTDGYKVDREFYTLYSGASEDPTDSGLTATMPDINNHWTDFSQGQIQPTGNPLDFAIEGKGFFTIKGPSGKLYTRNGCFHLNGKGDLVTADGYPILSTTGDPIEAQPSLALNVDKEGTVTQNGQLLGQMAIADFKNTAVLEKVGGNYYKPTDAKLKPPPATDAEVQQGKLEASNVVPAESTVQIVGVMRQFEMLQKAINLAAQMTQADIEQVAKVS